MSDMEYLEDAALAVVLITIGLMAFAYLTALRFGWIEIRYGDMCAYEFQITVFNKYSLTFGVQST